MQPPDNKKELIELFKQGPSLLEKALDGLTDADLDAVPHEGGWTIRQITHHIVDGDDVWKSCIKMALGNEQAEFTLDWYWAFPQDEWAKRWAYEKRSIDASLALLKANRDHILQLLEHVPDAWSRSVPFRKHNGETEQMPIGMAVKIQADHVVHHVNRILALRS